VTDIPTFPEILLAIARWMVYILIPADDSSKPTKQPFNPMTLTMGNRLEDTSSYPFAVDTLIHAMAYGTAEVHQHGPRFAGLGFRFEFDSIAPFIFVDIDNCRDSKSGEIQPWALEIIGRLNSYTEVSPSGKGIHILCRASRTPLAGNRKGNIEMYWRARWAAMTGQHVPGTPFDLMDRTDEVLALHAELFPPAPPAPPAAATSGGGTIKVNDDELLELARNSRNGVRFRMLFDEPPSRPNHSEEDLGLCSLLAFWTARDAIRIDRLFRCSALMRDKWNRSDYRERTIRKAIASCREVYSPTHTNNQGGNHGR
jgi:putative DNA primase/helicase